MAFAVLGFVPYYRHGKEAAGWQIAAIWVATRKEQPFVPVCIILCA